MYTFFVYKCLAYHFMRYKLGLLYPVLVLTPTYGLYTYSICKVIDYFSLGDRLFSRVYIVYLLMTTLL